MISLYEQPVFGKFDNADVLVLGYAVLNNGLVNELVVLIAQPINTESGPNWYGHSQFVNALRVKLHVSPAAGEPVPF